LSLAADAIEDDERAERERPYIDTKFGPWATQRRRALQKRAAFHDLDPKRSRPLRAVLSNVRRNHTQVIASRLRKANSGQRSAAAVLLDLVNALTHFLPHNFGVYEFSTIGRVDTLLDVSFELLEKRVRRMLFHHLILARDPVLVNG